MKPAKKHAKKPLQIRLGTMLIVVAIVGSACAIGLNLGGYTLLMAGLFASAALAHILGNAVGTRLRDEGTQRAATQQRMEKPVRKDDFAPPTQLRKRSGLGWPILIATALGGLVGGAVGGTLLAIVYASESTLTSVLMGVLACAVLGGFFAYMAAGFIQVAVGATRQATRDPNQRSSK